MHYRQNWQGILSICRKAGKLAMGLEPTKDAMYRGTPDIKELTWYLYRSTYNNALFHLRTQASRQNILRKMVAEEVELPDEQFALTVREELIRQLYVYIEDLPEERKKILLMSIQGHSGNEIADLLGISINTVKTQKNRGFKYLREKLKDSVLLFLL